MKLSTQTSRDADRPFSGQYVQGIGSWRTFDEFMRLEFASKRFSSSIRASYSSSRNDFSFINHDKKENIYDENHNIISSYHPKERNRSGAFKGFSYLGSASYDASALGRFSTDIWYLSTNRQLPLITSDYSTSSNKIDNRQREQTLRAVARWNHTGNTSRSRQAPDIYTAGLPTTTRLTIPTVFHLLFLTRARSRVNTAYGAFSWKGYPGDNGTSPPMPTFTTIA